MGFGDDTREQLVFHSPPEKQGKASAGEKKACTHMIGDEESPYVLLVLFSLSCLIIVSFAITQKPCMLSIKKQATVFQAYESNYPSIHPSIHPTLA